MKMHKPLPRSEYARHLTDLGDQCAFCCMSQDLTIYSYDYWLWAYAAFPYRKYHTIIIPKRHILTFSELETEEIIELKKIVAEVESRYKNSGIISISSVFGDQLFFCWRSRQVDEKKSVAHYHLHAYPKFGSADDSPLDSTSHDIDMSLLRK